MVMRKKGMRPGCWIRMGRCWASNTNTDQVDPHMEAYNDLQKSENIHRAVYGDNHPLAALPDRGSHAPPLRLMSEEEFADHVAENQVAFERTRIEVHMAFYGLYAPKATTVEDPLRFVDLSCS